MKTNIFLFITLLALTGFGFSVFAQTNTIPPPDKDIAYDKEPVVIKQVQPIYPASMLENGLEATVYVKAFIDLDGTVKEAQGEKIQIKFLRTGKYDSLLQERGTDGKDFEKSAVAAVRQWKFTPAQMQGKLVAVWVTIPFKFKLSGEDKKTSNEDSDDAKMEQIEKIVEVIKTNIENILKGTEIDKAKQIVSKYAFLIYNKETVNLNSVLNGEHKNIRLTEGKDSKCVNIKIDISDKYSSGLIIWTSSFDKGKKERVHSIVLTKMPSNEWKISHWHVSF
jgi:TonB family protein